MRKTNRLYLLLTAASLVAMPLIAVPARAATGEIYETNNGMVLRFTLAGGTPATFADGLSNPKGLAFDGNGHVFVAEAGRGTILRFTVPGGAGVTYASGLSSPVGVTFDRSGNLFVAESGNGNITQFASDGTRTTF